MPDWLYHINDAWMADEMYGPLIVNGRDARLPWEPSWLDIRMARLGHA